MATLEDLRSERWVIDTASSNYMRMLTQACQAAGFTPQIMARCNGFEVTVALIREGCAIAILPGLRASHDLEDVWVCRLKPEIRRKISIAFRKGEDVLRDKVNAALKAIKADGTYKRMADRYFDFDISGN